MSEHTPPPRRPRRERLLQSLGILAVATVVGVLLGYRGDGAPPLSPLASAILAAFGVFLIAVSSSGWRR